MYVMIISWFTSATRNDSSEILEQKSLMKKTFLHSRRGKVSGGWYSILTRNRYIYTLKAQRVLVVRESCAWKDHVVGTKPHRWYSLHVQYTHVVCDDVVWTLHSCQYILTKTKEQALVNSKMHIWHRCPNAIVVQQRCQFGQRWFYMSGS